jgi:hypothetical protein
MAAYDGLSPQRVDGTFLSCSLRLARKADSFVVSRSRKRPAPMCEALAASGREGGPSPLLVPIHC